jgi:uncharacterized protein YndB with AHSA1/START domain
MSETEEALGQIRRTGDTVEIVFRRHYARPIEKVWAALTVPERISDWFAQTTIVGDRMTLDFPEVNHRMESRIVEKVAPRVFAWTWPLSDGTESLVRFELEPDGDGCTLTLTQSNLMLTDGAGNGAGWHAHLAGVLDAVDGRKTSWDTIIGRQKAIKPAYVERAPA